MGPGMGRIVRMTKSNAGNHLFYDLQKILLSPLPDFTGGDGGSRMGNKHRAQTLRQLRFADHSLDLISQIHDLLQLCRADA